MQRTTDGGNSETAPVYGRFGSCGHRQFPHTRTFWLILSHLINFPKLSALVEHEVLPAAPEVA